MSAYGKIVPCCMIGDDKVVNFGSVIDKKFTEIWNSIDYQNFRKSIKNNELKDFCKNCYKEFRDL